MQSCPMAPLPGLGGRWEKGMASWGTGYAHIARRTAGSFFSPIPYAIMRALQLLVLPFRLTLTCRESAGKMRGVLRHCVHLLLGRCCCRRLPLPPQHLPSLPTGGGAPECGRPCIHCLNATGTAQYAHSFARPSSARAFAMGGVSRRAHHQLGCFALPEPHAPAPLHGICQCVLSFRSPCFFKPRDCAALPPSHPGATHQRCPMRWHGRELVHTALQHAPGRYEGLWLGSWIAGLPTSVLHCIPSSQLLLDPRSLRPISTSGRARTLPRDG